MSITPWGPADRLRSKRLRPGPGTSRRAVARNQRERLYGATIAVVADQGYETTRVADILEVAGVSRSAFYRHFANKEECFLATLDALVEVTAQAVAGAYRREGTQWDERLRVLFDGVVELIVTQPAAARVWFVETFSAGPEAVERVERLTDELERLAIESLNETAERTDMPRPLVRAIIGGLRQIIQTRLRHDEEAQLTELVPALLAWALSYRTPAAPLRRPRKPPRLPPTTADPDPRRAKILDAVTELVAEKSYRAMTITEIAQRAAISLTTFYRYFESKEAVFLAAIDDGERRLIETSLPAYRQGPDWPRSVKDGLHAFFAFFAENGATARLGGLNIFAGGPEALERYERATIGFEGLLLRGYREHPDASPVAGEAIRGAIAALLYQQLRIEGTEGLYEIAPTATFIALAPFVGSDEATAVANEGWRPQPA